MSTTRKLNTFNQLIPIIKKYYSYSMEEIIQGVLKCDPLFITLFQHRLKEMVNIAKDLKKWNQQEYLRKENESKIVNQWCDLLKSKLIDPTTLSDQELLVLTLIFDGKSMSHVDEFSNLFYEMNRRCLNKAEQFSVSSMIILWYDCKLDHSYYFFEKAIDSHFSKGIIGLSLDSVRETIADSHSLIKKAAEKGNADALCFMGNAYLDKDVNLAEQYYIESLKAGNVLEALKKLADLYKAKGDISESSKFIAVYEYYLAPFDKLYCYWDSQRLLDEKPQNINVIYHAYYTYALYNGWHHNKTKEQLNELSQEYLLDSKNDNSEFNKLLEEEDWGKYEIVPLDLSPEDTQIKPDTIYLYPSEINKDYDIHFVNCDQPNSEMKDQEVDKIKFSNLDTGKPTLIKRQDQFMLYGNLDGTPSWRQWKSPLLETKLDSNIFLSLKDIPSQKLSPELVTIEMYNEINAKRAHTAYISYAVKKPNGDIAHDIIAVGNILNAENFSPFIIAIQNKSIDQLTSKDEEALLDILSRKGSIPRNKIFPLLNPSLAKQAHKKKLSCIPLVEYYLQKLILEAGIAEKITSFAINISPTERRQIRNGKIIFQNTLSKKGYNFFLPELSNKKMDNPKQDTYEKKFTRSK